MILYNYLDYIFPIGLTILGFVIFFYAYLVYQKYWHPILQAQRVIKKNSLTFYKAFSKIEDVDKRHAIYAVYAFCRTADDLVDENQDEQGLLKLEEELKAFINHEPLKHWRWQALKITTKPFYDETYDYKPFFEMIYGQKMDLNHQGYETLDDLLKYCYYVAGTVGLMLIPILSPDNKQELKDFAIHLGYGMQLTNILRDIGEDFKNNRIYLPKDLMIQANYSKEDLAHGIINREFIELFESLAQLAERYFDEALSQIDLFPKDSKLPLALSIILYRAIIDSCRDHGYDVFTKKNYVSDEKKKQLIDDYIRICKEQ